MQKVSISTALDALGTPTAGEYKAHLRFKSNMTQDGLL